MLSTFFLFDRRLITRFDVTLFFIALLIVGFGIFNLYSASVSAHAVGAVYKKQVYWVFIGLFLLFFGAFLNYSYLEQFGYFFYFFILLLLVLVLFQGKFISGSRRWISLGLFNVQPSEFVKLSLIIVLAKWFKNKYDPRGLSLFSLLIPSFFSLIPFLLVFLQPDLGSALLLLLIFLSLVLFVRVGFRTLFVLCFCAFLFLPLSWNYLLKDYQKDRVIHFLDPSLDPLGKGYQVLQSKIAVGSGKFLGKGYLRGTQSQLNFVPEKYTDFVFSVFCEEWGFLGALVLGFLYLGLLFRFLFIASAAKNSFGLILGNGIIALFFWQIIINIAMTLGLLPTVGITLPLFSYGGSSLAVSLFCVGVMINIHIQKHIF